MVTTPNAESEQSKTITLRQKSARSANTFSLVNMHHDGGQIQDSDELTDREAKKKSENRK